MKRQLGRALRLDLSEAGGACQSRDASAARASYWFQNGSAWVVSNTCNIDPDELLTLHEIGAAWLAAEARRIAQALEEGILQEVIRR
jgi:hypothetical protein